MGCANGSRRHGALAAEGPVQPVLRKEESPNLTSSVQPEEELRDRERTGQAQHEIRDRVPSGRTVRVQADEEPRNKDAKPVVQMSDCGATSMEAGMKVARGASASESSKSACLSEASEVLQDLLEAASQSELSQGSERMESYSSFASHDEHSCVDAIPEEQIERMHQPVEAHSPSVSMDGKVCIDAAPKETIQRTCEAVEGFTAPAAVTPEVFAPLPRVSSATMVQRSSISASRRSACEGERARCRRSAVFAHDEVAAGRGALARKGAAAKSVETREFLTIALERTFACSELDDEAMDSIVDSCFRCQLAAGSKISQERHVEAVEDGKMITTTLYQLLVLESGQLRVDSGRSLVSSGEVVGDLAVLHDRPWVADLVAEKPSVAWSVDRGVVNAARRASAIRQRAVIEGILSQVLAVASLGREDRGRLVDAMDLVVVEAGEVIIQKGAQHLALHLVLDGKAETVKSKGIPVAKFLAGSYFGAEALLEVSPASKADVKTTTRCIFAVLQYEAMDRLVGLLPSQSSEASESEHSARKHQRKPNKREVSGNGLPRTLLETRSLQSRDNDLSHVSLSEKHIGSRSGVSSVVGASAQRRWNDNATDACSNEASHSSAEVDPAMAMYGSQSSCSREESNFASELHGDQTSRSPESASFPEQTCESGASQGKAMLRPPTMDSASKQDLHEIKFELSKLMGKLLGTEIGVQGVRELAADEAQNEEGAMVEAAAARGVQDGNITRSFGTAEASRRRSRLSRLAGGSHAIPRSALQSISLPSHAKRHFFEWGFDEFGAYVDKIIHENGPPGHSIDVGDTLLSINGREVLCLPKEKIMAVWLEENCNCYLDLVFYMSEA